LSVSGIVIRTEVLMFSIKKWSTHTLRIKMEEGGRRIGYVVFQPKIGRYPPGLFIFTCNQRAREPYPGPLPRK
jgi:hypothetical protein